MESNASMAFVNGVPSSSSPLCGNGIVEIRYGGARPWRRAAVIAGAERFRCVLTLRGRSRWRPRLAQRLSASLARPPWSEARRGDVREPFGFL